MIRPNHSTEALIVPIAGAGNIGRERWSTAAPHFHWLMRHLRNKPNRVVAPPIVPGQFGLRRLESTYDRFADRLNDLTDQHPDARVIAIGHSLGGLLAHRFSTEVSISGLITLGAPHAGLRSYLPAAIREEYGAFANATPLTIMNNTAQIATRYDELVSPQSAHAGMSRSQTFLLSRHNLLPLTHNGLPLAPAVTHLVGRLVDEMLVSEQLPPGRSDYGTLQEPA
jgi:pimeloyl-ACP methyl ester carboxylesterase